MGSPAPAVPETIDSTLLLIGDAGLPRLEAPEPVLEALRREAAQSPERTVVVFLGDNIYPDGLPAPGSKTRPRAEAALRRQVEALDGARGIFVPGNHDYHAGGRAAVLRQAEYVAALDDSLATLGDSLAALGDSLAAHDDSLPGLDVPRVELRPRDGCPGPEIADVGERLRLILLDTQWWLDAEVARTVPTICPTASEDAILGALAQALSSASGRHALVLAHHPPASHGVHGGHHDWRDHLFPLSRAKSWLWIPLPILGSLYPLYRGLGGYGQDIPASRYEHMIARIDSTCAAHPPLAWAGGHDHSLQILSGRRGVPYVLVSGAGSVARPDAVGRGDDTLAASPHPGFVRLDALRDGRVRLEVVEVHEDGEVRRPWSVWLAPRGPAVR